LTTVQDVAHERCESIEEADERSRGNTSGTLCRGLPHDAGMAADDVAGAKWRA